MATNMLLQHATHSLEIWYRPICGAFVFAAFSNLFKMIRWPINNWSKQCQRNEFECEVGSNMAINQWPAAFNLA